MAETETLPPPVDNGPAEEAGADCAMLDLAALQTYLRTQIPMAAAMGAQIVAATGAEIRLTAPLEPNINHQSTAFGGSLSTLAVLTGWTAVHCLLKTAGMNGQVVIQRSRYHYLAPVDRAFEAVCRPPDPEAVEDLWDRLKRYRKARVRLAVDILCGGTRTGSFEGDYVIVAP
jgi:thioesterase domain-containing protein